MNRTFILRSTDIRDRAQAYVGDLPLQEPPLEVRIALHRKKRTLDQNDRYHGIVRAMASFLGYTEREMAEILKEELLEPKVVIMNNRPHKIWPSTADFTTFEMSNYCEQILAFAALEGVPTT